VPYIKILIREVEEADYVQSRLKRELAYDCIIVKDNGIGFSQHHEEKVFMPFQRLVTMPSVKGSGMGLAVCKRIMETYEGAISVVSSENQGAEFRLFFPRYLISSRPR
jgi:signal transduction histidine kinase